MIASIIQLSHNYPHVPDEVWMNIKPHTKFYVSLSFVLMPNVTVLKHFWCLHFNYLGVIIIGRYGAIIIGYKHGALTLLTPHPLGLDLSLGLTPHCSSIDKPHRKYWYITFKKVRTVRLLKNAQRLHLQQIFYNQAYHTFLILWDLGKQQHGNKRKYCM